MCLFDNFATESNYQDQDQKDQSDNDLNCDIYILIFFHFVLFGYINLLIIKVAFIEFLCLQK